MKKWSSKIAGILIGVMLLQPIGVCAEEMNGFNSAVETESHETESSAESTETEITETEIAETEVVTEESVEENIPEETLIEDEICEEPFLLESSAGCVTVEVSGIRYYEYAYKALEFMNEMRAEEGLEPLVMDATLLEQTMLRSAELTLRFNSSARPNGTYLAGMAARHGSCGLSRDDYYWLDEPSQQDKILNSAYKSVGIGCFYNNGYYYWANFYSSAEGIPVVKSGSESVNERVEILEENLVYSSDVDANLSLYDGETEVLKVYQSYSDDGTTVTTPYYKRSIINPSLLTWTSSNAQVASTDADGTLNCYKGGNAVISAKYNGKVVYQWRITVINRTEVVNPTVSYNGPTVYESILVDACDYAPYFTIKYNGKTLTQDDFTVIEYEWGANGVITKFVILFMGKYKGEYEYLPQQGTGNEDPTIEPVDLIESFVTRLYEVCLNRKPDSSGLATWKNELKSGKSTGIQAAYGFIFSNEFKSKNLCNEDYVEQLYKAFMGRSSDASGKATWVKLLENGTTREEVFNGFALSQEFKRLCRDYGITQGSGIEVPTYGTVPEGKCSVCGKAEGIAGFVIRLYNVCLGREADEVGMSTWVNLLKTHQSSGRDVAYGFIFSKEFVNKKYNNEDYVEHLYEAFMGRSSDPQGKATWLNLLASGWTREQVFDGFVGSDEFTAICESYGITRG